MVADTSGVEALVPVKLLIHPLFTVVETICWYASHVSSALGYVAEL
jgi:hypothetical protein